MLSIPHVGDTAQARSLLRPGLLVTLLWDQPTPGVPEADNPAHTKPPRPCPVLSPCIQTPAPQLWALNPLSLSFLSVEGR